MTALQVDVTAARPGFALDVSFEVEAGHTLALLGPNGAGKSTTIELIAGLIQPDSGRVALGEAVFYADGVAMPPEQRRVGVVFQDYVLFPHLDVRDNLAFGPRSRGATNRAARTQAETWLDRLGLNDLARKRPSELSGGQAQRVAVARALASDPRALLLDEPLSALDVGARAQVRSFLARHLKDFPGPRIVVTHEPTEAFMLADRIAIIEGGAITQIDTPEGIRRAPGSRYAADLVGINLYRGAAHDGQVDVGDGHTLTIADTGVRGDVLVTIHPRAVGLYTTQPEGSPRNTWQATVLDIQHLGDRNRVDLDGPLGITAEITPAATTGLGLAPGLTVWISVKATEIGVQATDR
ncbi:MAG: ABC transporter ATP-binding protein [Acidimicrobiia bacterium]|nr:ABC transporter ATP-binding protein [Acidimicrobiia bacterium]